MSLLMDALKRAEKARQAQAAKQADGQRASTSRLALDPLEDDNRATTTSSEPVDSPQPEPSPESPQPSNEPPEPPPSPAAAGPSTTNFSLSDDFPPTEKTPPPPPPGGEKPGGEKLGPFSLVRDDEMSLEDTGEMLPVVQEAERSLNRYFDDPDATATTDADSEGAAGDEDSTVLGSPRDREGRGSDSSARRAAESVFKAKAPIIAKNRRDRAVMIALPLLLLAGIGIGVLIFWNQLERAFFGSPQLLPPRPPQTVELPPTSGTSAVSEAEKLAAAAEAAANAQPPTSNETSPPSGETSATAAASEPMTGAALAAANTSGTGAVSVPPSAASTAAAGSFDGGAAAATAATSSTREAMLPRLPPATVGRPYAAASMGGVRISRRSKPDTIHSGINEAYLAFQRGDDARARALYAEVNRQHPNNRNALLGLGAVALRSGSYGEAARIYARLLSINPRDPIARAALINLNQRVPAGEGESHVRRLLLDDPEQSFLYHTLGNLYARQGRWVEAQQAYFDAYRLESNNADFAFNLAVSLDRLGQPAAALSYYQRALALAADGTAGFEPRAARIRIERLKGGQG